MDPLLLASSHRPDDGDEEQLSLQPLLNLNDPGYGYDDYQYGIDDDEDSYDDSLPYDDYNTEIIHKKSSKQMKSFSSSKLLPNTMSFSQRPTSAKDKSNTHPNSVLPLGIVKNVLEPNSYGKDETTDLSSHKIRTKNYLANKSKYHKNYMLQNPDGLALPDLHENPVIQKHSILDGKNVNIKGGTTSTHSANDLPQFLRHPVDSYIIRRKAAILVCEVTGADKAYFLCNGEAMGAGSKLGDKQSSLHGQHREEDTVRLADEKDMTGRMITVKKLSLEVTESQIEEFFGLYTCRCDAWNKKGRSSSSNATVEISCKYQKLFLHLSIAHFYLSAIDSNRLNRSRNNSN